MTETHNKRTQIALVCLGLLVLLAWLGWFYLSELGRAYGNAPSSPDTVGLVVATVAVMSLGFAGLALFHRGTLGRVYALAPVVLVILGELLIQVLLGAARSARSARRASRSANIAAHVATLPQTFTGPTEEDGHSSFLFVDETTGFLMLIGHDADSLDVVCLGSVSEGSLTLEENMQPLAGEVNFLSEYGDAAGHSPLDEYELRYTDELNILLCDYERYEFRE